MKGIQVYFTGKERKLLLNALSQFIDYYSDFYEGSIKLEEMMNDGLGKVMFKVYKGLEGEYLYEKFKS